MSFKYKNVIYIFLDLLLKATRNKIPKITKGIYIQVALFIIFYMGSSFVYCVENINMYKNFEDNGTIRDSAFFRNLIFGKKALFGLDIVIMMWGALISIVALSFFLFMNNALIVAYKQFDRGLKKKLEDGDIREVDMLLDVENQITDFLKAFLYFNNTASGLLA
uniref:Uncharacterized protein n=1 Tax=Acrobeloides nanus TaxID=290746 RepID=A0A914BZK0_9BILA